MRVLKQGLRRLILGCTVTGPEVRAHIDGLLLAPLEADTDHRVYVPLRFVLNEKISASDKLLLAFDALALSHGSGKAPHLGIVIHGREYAKVTVPLTPLYRTVRSIVASLAAQNAGSTPPPLLLNKHCAGCEYESRCRELAIAKDDLSLLSNMSEKERKKHHEKGIFTVTQLSYTFRPRKRSGQVSRHEPALKALAIRKNQIHAIGDCGFSAFGTPVYFDVEGDSDRDFFYLVGLRYQAAGSTIQRSYWADDPLDEQKMWTEFLSALSTIDAPRLIHYGSYETQFLRRMQKRYPSDEHAGLLAQVTSSAVNLLSLIYAHVYFPTYSNRLKEVARYLGFCWSESSASGLYALSWRLQWERSRVTDLKKRLLVYNAEDCAAAQRVAEALSATSRSLPPHHEANANIVNVNSMKREYPQRFGQIDFALPEFQQINDSARWNHQRDRVYVRTNDRVKKRLQRAASKRKAEVHVNRIIMVEDPRPTACSRCGATQIYRFGRLSQVVYDLKLFSGGIKRWVVRYSYQRYICGRCKGAFHQHAHRLRYGDNISAYVVYQIIELLLPQNATAKSMEQLFGLPVSRGLINHLKARMAQRYEATYRTIIDRIVGGKLVHADETRAAVAGKAAYVWVFTSMEEVAFVYSETREANTALNVLQNFRGVLVSDFYAGYDAVDCAQQKCLIHLMRDINEDLDKQPFNDEMKKIAKEFADLLRPIVGTVDRFGLKARHLLKHARDVERFYKALSRQDCQTELAAGYVKRFEKNRGKLFTFLDYDGVPWNNNNAEHAIKAFVRLRNIIGGTSTEKGIRDYLVLLSISETCKCKGARFLDFLLSGGSDINTFVD